MTRKIPTALTIAGSDSGGGAGIQADLKTFEALGVYGTSAITSVTAQNTRSVDGKCDLPDDFVGLQIDSVMRDIGADAVKTGMLSNASIVSSVAARIGHYGVKKLVVDPVMRSKSGDVLLDEEAVSTMLDKLIPLALIVTPNIPEAELLSGMKIHTFDDIKESAVIIKAMGPGYVLMKGGHFDSGDRAVDILYDGAQFHEFSSERIETKNTHGTGCTYSAAIAAYLARHMSLLNAVREAKSYLTEALRSSFNLGGGYGPLNHHWKKGLKE